MNTNIKRLVERASALFAALALGSGITVFQLLTPSVAHATFSSGSQLQARAIYLSNSASGATNVSYLVTFKVQHTTSIKAIVLDFCSNSPLIGDSTCTAPTGFSVKGANANPAVTVSAQTAGTNSPITTLGLPVNGGSWTAAAANSNRTLKLTNANGTGALTANSTDPYSFILTTTSNPTATFPPTNNGDNTFYARLVTYDDNAAGTFTTYAPGSEDGTDAIDYGGYALSVAQNISITAKVQETLTFCTSGPDTPGGSTNPMNDSTANDDCRDATAPSLTLGHGTPQVLDNTAVDGANAYTQTSTNATNGVTVRMHATNSCSGLSKDGGTTCPITGINNTAAGAVTAGTTFFGLFVAPSTTTTGVAASSGTIVPDLNYNATGSTAAAGAFSGNSYGMDNTANSGVTSTYGDTIASSASGVGGSGPVYRINNRLIFAATASLTVPSGIYTGQENLIATGTF